MYRYRINIWDQKTGNLLGILDPCSGDISDLTLLEPGRLAFKCSDGNLLTLKIFDFQFLAESKVSMVCLSTDPAVPPTEHRVLAHEVISFSAQYSECPMEWVGSVPIETTKSEKIMLLGLSSHFLNQTHSPGWKLNRRANSIVNSKKKTKEKNNPSSFEGFRFLKDPLSVLKNSVHHSVSNIGSAIYGNCTFYRMVRNPVSNEWEFADISVNDFTKKFLNYHPDPEIEDLPEISTVWAEIIPRNFLEILNPRRRCWIINASFTYRMKMNKTADSICTQPTNGVILAFEPITGLLRLKYIHSSVWPTNQRLGQTTKTISAQEIAKLIASLPDPPLPDLILDHVSLLNVLTDHMGSFPNLVMKMGRLRIPALPLLKIQPFCGIDDLSPLECESSKTYMLYDQWLDSCSAQVAFQRLALLLRALNTDPEETKSILSRKETWEIDLFPKESRFWPKLSEADWKEVELDLEDMVLMNLIKDQSDQDQVISRNQINDLILSGTYYPEFDEQEDTHVSWGI